MDRKKREFGTLFVVRCCFIVQLSYKYCRGIFKSKFERIVRDPEICGGQPTIKGTRVMVWIIFECIKGGLCFTEILENYPSITQEDIDAAFDYIISILQKTNQ